MSEQRDGQADITASVRVLFKFMHIAQVAPKDGKILTFVNAINYLILLPISVFRFSRRMLIRWWPSGLLHHVIYSFRRFGWPSCLHLYNDWNWFRWMQVPPKRWNKYRMLDKTNKTIIWTLPWLVTAAEKMAESVQRSVSKAAGQATARSQAGQRPGDRRILGQVLEGRRGARTTWRFRQPAGLDTLLGKPSRLGPYSTIPL